MRIDARQQNSESMPDVSVFQKSDYASRLSQVGMGKIEMPILFASLPGPAVLLPASIDAFVSLDDPNAKGIHMSRLYLEIKNSLRDEAVTAASLKSVLQKFLSSHEGLSESAFIELRFGVPLERKALVSEEIGYRQYPVTLKARIQNKKFEFSMATEIMYSSTCPCSAALARQLLQQAFIERFDKDLVSKTEVADWLVAQESMVAFPHAQRSIAKIEVRIKEGLSSPCLVELINAAEGALGTPVQAAVKRVDEQEFARLNALNLMFCEDAARKLRGLFEEDVRISDYFIHVEHLESLHPHDAVSRVVKGVQGGFSV